MAKSPLPTNATCVAIALMTTRLAAANPTDRAREHYDRAVHYYDQHDYAAALRELRRAEDLRPNPVLKRSIAQVLANMSEYAAAYMAYRLYLEQGSEKIPPEQREEVNEEMAKLARLVVLLTISVDVPGATVRVDDTPVGQAPLRSPIALNGGPHVVVVSHPGHPDQSRLMTAVAGSSERLDFSFTVRQPSAPPGGPFRGDADAAGELLAVSPTLSTEGAPIGPSPAPTQDDSPFPLWVGWVATGALAAGATATGLWALSDDSSLTADRTVAESLGNGDSERLDSRASRVRMLATVTDVLWVAAAAAGGITLWFTLDSRESGRQGASERLAVQAGVGLQGVSVRTTF